MQYREIYKKDISGAFLFYGYERLLMDNAIEYVKKKYVSRGMETFNLSLYDGNNLTEDKLMSSCETLPVMNDKRVIFVKGANAFSESVTKEFYKFLDNIGEFLILVFLDEDNKIDKTKTFYKYFSKNNRAIEFPKLSGKDIFNFIEGYLVRKGFDISKSDISYLSLKSGYDSKNLDMTLYDLKNELDKMLVLSEVKKIDREVIDRSMTQNADSNIFNFLDALCNKNTEKSLMEFKKLHLLNEPIERIFSMIVRQVRLLIMYGDLKSNGYKDVQAMNYMGIKQYEYSKISKFSHNFDLKFLYQFYEKLLNIDEYFKTTQLSKYILLEMLIVEFTK
ncbi:DNA polymerase III subunit delta [Peptoniphilus mikwangii]|uniref:DNA polymerase III subunit delta n=1 Tax=Peptoniphilus mikwangii TaxID=1354300 RepID=UPI0003146DBF|nr:DNA polymerase III subunit delta [Peptoniphilus mikwangii]